MREPVIRLCERKLFIGLAVYALAAYSSRLLEIADPVRGLLAYTVFVAIPLIIGRLLIEVVCTVLEKPMPQTRHLLLQAMLYWFPGSLTIFFIAASLSALGAYSIVNTTIIIMVMLVASILFDFTPVSYRLNLEYSVKYDSLKLAAIAFASGVLAVALLRSILPYPLQPNYDMFQDFYLIGRMMYYSEFHITPREFLQYAYTRPATTLYDLMVTVSAYWTQADVLAVFWSAPIIQNGLFGISLYVWASRVFREKLPSITTAVIGTWILEYRPQGMTQFRSDRLLILILPLLLYAVEEWFAEGSMDRSKLLYMALISAVAIILHQYSGAFLTIILILYIILSKGKLRRECDLIPMLAVLLVAAIRLLKLSLPAEFSINVLGPVGKYPGTEIYRLTLMEGACTILVVGMFLAGIVLALLENGVLRKISVFASIILLTYYAPLWGVLRVALYIHPFVALFTAYSITYIIREVLEPFGDKDVKVVLSLLLLAFTLFGLIAPIGGSFTNLNKSYKRFFKPSFSLQELEAAIWIRENTPKDSVIVSDAITQQVIRGLSFRDGVGRSYMLSDDRMQILYEAFESNDTERTVQLILSILPESFKNRSIYIVITGRTTGWLNSENPRMLFWPPREIVDYTIINRLNNSDDLSLVYSVDSQVFIFRLNRGLNSD